MTQALTPFGRLFLVPAPLDFGCNEDIDLQQVMPMGTISAVANITHWICENAKTTRAYLKRIDACTPLKTSIQTQNIVELPRQVHKKGDHLGGYDAKPLLTAALEGEDMGLVSEAGMPAVADPGSSVVRAAHELGIQVIPLIGPVSLLLALASSGLNGQNFAFVGYLPQEPQDRVKRIKELEQYALKTGQTQLFIETPYRNTALWSSLVQTLQPVSRLAFSSGLTLTSAVNQSSTIQQWRKLPSGKMPEGLNNQTPAVFAMGV
ncbi:MAG: SAM-dependent methyltransferase [Betaproteobacteria bacterium]|jgi:16S rRNA (cytidine1402-2'-O)-methyltransferase